MKYFKNKIPPSFSPELLNEYFENTGSNKNHRICNAPFSGLYFTPSGLIKPCCAHSDMLAFGRYPETRIHQVLKSPERKKLQQHINNNNLLYGCNACLQNISTGNYRGSISSLYSKYGSARKLKIIDFELSHFCNLDCVMCYLHNKNPVNNQIYGKHFLEEIKPYLKHIEASRFYGGEPFVIDTYYKIWEYFIKHNPSCQVHIQTNGNVYNNNIKLILEKLNAFIGISIDAMTDTLYEQIRRGANFKTLLTNTLAFNEIMQSQSKSLTISFCPMPINWQEIPAVFDFADTLKSMLFFNTVTHPPQFSFGYLSSSEIVIIANTLKQYKPPKSTNPHQTENYKTLQDMLNGFFALADKQKIIEKEIPSISLQNFFLELINVSGQDQLIDELKLLMKDFNPNMKVSRYLLYNFRQLSKKESIYLISNIVNKGDLDYLNNIFHND